MKRIQYFSFLILCLSVAACSDPENFFNPIVDIDLPPHKSKLVLFADFQAETDSLVVHLTHTRSALDTATSRIRIYDTIRFGSNTYVNQYYVDDTLKNAKVELFRNDVLWGTFLANKYGRYILRKKLVNDGATYRLRAEAPSYDVVEATQKMPATATLDSVRFVKDGAIIQDGLDTYKEDEFTYFFKDPAETGNYYSVAAYFYYGNNDNEIYLQSLDKLSQSNILSDKSFNGKAYNWRLHGKLWNTPVNGNRIEYKLSSSSSDLLQFLRSKELVDNAQGNPFAEPVILYYNIKNGYGLFALTTTTTWIKRY